MDESNHTFAEVGATEIIYPNGSKTEGRLVLPEARVSHCMVEYAGIVIVIGGRQYVTEY